MAPEQTKKIPLMTLPAIDVSSLDSGDQDTRNQFVGNSIYNLIMEAYGPEICPRITGMLLDENAVNYKQLLTDNVYFNNKVAEAHALLTTPGNQ